MSRRVALRRVFLSSTARDLRDHRAAVYEAIEGMDHYHCVRMEDFGARSLLPDEFCRNKVLECDVFVGLIGHIYGDSPQESGPSFTEREYDAAVASEKPLLIFVAPDDFAIPALLLEPDDRRVKQQCFRRRVSVSAVRAQFVSPSDLALRVVQSIRNWEQEQVQIVSDNREVMAMLLVDDWLAARVLVTIGAVEGGLTANAVAVSVGDDLDRIAVILAELTRLGALVVRKNGFVISERMRHARERLSHIIGAGQG